MRRLVPIAVAVLVILVVSYPGATWLIGAVEEQLYQGDIVVSRQTRFQKVVVTRADHGGVDMHLDGHLQFSSLDERRYHEAMTHPAMMVNEQRARVLIIGGGDGLIAREVLRYPDVEQIVLVDIDAELLEIAQTEPVLTEINGGSLTHPRVVLHAADGFVWLRDHPEPWDRIFMDLPDPRSGGVARLFSVEFFEIVKRRLTPAGVVVVQAASPYYTPHAYWSAVTTVEAAGLTVQPAHVNVPSFGEWGFVYASKTPMEFAAAPLPPDLHFLTPGQVRAMFDWPLDLVRKDVEASHFDRPIILKYYSDDSARWR
jgi:spermidine synthase